MGKAAMKFITMFACSALCSTAAAWGPGWGPGWNPGWWPGMYGGMGYGGGYSMNGMAMIQTPSFNYTTTIIQSPPIIINQTGEVLNSEPRHDQGEWQQDTYSGNNR